jgi:hypothetical protein
VLLTLTSHYVIAGLCKRTRQIHKLSMCLLECSTKFAIDLNLAVVCRSISWHTCT